ncbi:MAG TPA: tRNA pseudouridine(65) synthase TruC [Gammaproteobacteria bacterium]|nr:tRNA pseudouridine(65) synthase TruC [Xanthomonadales bacterium]HOP22404.1 tRNA pseudouridine(65) synthase TruC [Gammaproteobacteria bacterium]HPI96212.1 tRNA pseudouridine(65) synthase TruC [Gammaproteobacteria bacterium]HPQ88227.1 tRNA pseudouridine(65) synthase TruC [Gammaproteobacteria bacterium]
MLPILYQDEHIVIIDKPSGLLVHRSLIDKRETRFALQMTRDQIGQYVYPVHRLDKPTSGVLVMALSSEVAAQLTEQFTQKQVSKKYVALVRGYTDDNGTIDYPLQEQLDKIADKNTKPDKPAQDAVTHYETLWKGEVPIPVGRYSSARYSLVSLTPETGRKHQIRRHMKHIFHPIIGDTTHGDGKHNNMFREQFALSRLLLVAKEIRFNHPESGESITISAPLGEEFERILTGLNCSIRLS